MKSYQCKNCGSIDFKKREDGKYFCVYCKHIYTDISLENAYIKACQGIRANIKKAVSEEFLKNQTQKIANCRQNLYNVRKRERGSNKDVRFWANEILKINPDDVQARFYEIAAREDWAELNVYLSKFDVKGNSIHIIDFVDFLTKDRFVEKCILRLSDLISKAFEENSANYEKCRRKIASAIKKCESGIFDPTLSRDVFVAYSSKDSEKANELVDYLEEKGLTCFISSRNMPKGVDAALHYDENIKQAIDNCRVFLFVSSNNSRTRNCDAYRIELAYVKQCDLRNCGNKNYYNSNYDLYLEKYRNKCKPRVEWLINNYSNSTYDKEVKKFFKGFSWYSDKKGILNAIAYYIENASYDEELDENAKRVAEQEYRNAEFERRQAAMEQELYELRKENEEIKRQNEENARFGPRNGYGPETGITERIGDFAVSAIRYSVGEKRKERYDYYDDDDEEDKAQVVFWLCLFLGIFGVHRFYQKKFLTGFLYLCTYGLFFIGWIIDIIRCAIKRFKFVD